MSPVIDEQGNPQTWTAVYWRYHARYEHEADSLEDALSFLSNGEDEGALSSEKVLGPNGEVVISEDEIFDATFGYGRFASQSRETTLRALTAGAP